MANIYLYYMQTFLYTSTKTIQHPKIFATLIQNKLKFSIRIESWDSLFNLWCTENKNSTNHSYAASQATVFLSGKANVFFICWLNVLSKRRNYYFMCFPNNHCTQNWVTKDKQNIRFN